jgi:monovalent cation:H+ antiporter-2, CPA2 family
MNTFLFQGFIYLCAAVIAVPIAKRLGLGSVLGYLAAGVIIGPFGLSLVYGSGHDIMHFAEFGVVMMLFLIGLELRPVMLWRLRAAILGLGGAQVAATAVVIAVVVAVMDTPWQQALAIGLTLALSSTALVLQTLHEKNLMKTSVGRKGFAVLLFQDIAVIPILALLPLLAMQAVSSGNEQGYLHQFPTYVRTLLVFGSIAFIIISGRYIIRPLFRFIAKTGLRELFAAGALLLVIGAAVLMTSVGISPALGTFVAGVVLADNEYRHEIEHNIEPFKGLLLGLFFIAVGASIDFLMISEQVIAILVAVTLLIVLKLIVLLILGRFAKLPLRDNIQFAVLLAQGGEFAFVLLSFATQEAVLSLDQANFWVAVVAISMLATPVLLLLLEKIILPLLHSTRSTHTVQEDSFEESNPVIIAGFGDFGAATGRFLRSNGINCTVLDTDSERVELLRKIGIQTFYGDASRLDILHSAGADEAKILIVALNEPAKSMDIVRMAQTHFPHLKIYARARGRAHNYDLLAAEVNYVYLDVLDTSLRLGADVLAALGERKYKAHRKAVVFRQQEETGIGQLWSLRHDSQAYINQARMHIDDLAQTMRRERHQLEGLIESDWDIDAVREERKQMPHDAGTHENSK